MSRNLRDAIVVVTGGARGIGFEIVNHFLANKAKLAVILDINDLDKESLNILNSKYGEKSTVLIKCDITKDLDEVVENIYRTYKFVDVLVNCAGIVRENSIKLAVNVNTIALMECTYKFWNLMRTDKGGNGGTIINICSICSFRIIPIVPVYIGTKFAAYGFTKSLGHQYHYDRSGVRVVAICPGYTKTKLGVDIEEPDILHDLREITKTLDWQEATDVGRGAVEVFVKANSGSAWLIEGGKPPSEITN